MKKHEAELQRIFSRWLAHNKKRGVYELKRTTGTRIPFSDLKEHQRDALLKSSKKKGGIVHKIADDSLGQKPFDTFCLNDVPGYVVVSFGPKVKHFYIIPIKKWLALEQKLKAKSITEGQARLVGVGICVHS